MAVIAAPAPSVIPSPARPRRCGPLPPRGLRDHAVGRGMCVVNYPLTLHAVNLCAKRAGGQFFCNEGNRG